MKLRQTPSDFIVDEILGIELSETLLSHRIYTLTKTSLESFALFVLLSKKLNIPLASIGYCGLKDKHAITTQYISIPTSFNVGLVSGLGYTLTPVGYLDRALTLGDHKGNKFTITARGILRGEFEGIVLKSKLIDQGVPNYFDSQRFGSVTESVFIAKYVLKHEYKKAVVTYLTQPYKFDSTALKKEKEYLLTHQDSLESCRVSDPALKKVLDVYKQTLDFKQAYMTIDRRLRHLYFSAYQSYLFNESVKEYLLKHLKKTNRFTVEYALGKLVFYKKLPESGFIESFPLVSHKLNAVSPFIQKVLDKEDMTLDDFKSASKVGQFFTPQDRALISYPQSFTISDFLVDEVNDSGRQKVFKVVVSFELLKGSYATVVTKRIFNN